MKTAHGCTIDKYSHGHIIQHTEIKERNQTGC